MTDVVRADLQGNILCGYGPRYGHGLFLFFRIERPDAARQWLGERIADVTTALSWPRDQEPPSTLNVALSHAGLRALGLAEEVLDKFSEAFRGGMEARADRLGDTGTSEPHAWEEGLRRLHGVVTVTARERSVRDQLRNELEAGAADAGLAVACAQEVQAQEREPFGFRDGLSQPAIRDPRAGPWPRRGDVPIEPGEFVLGYPDEGGTTPPAPSTVGDNGSYMVVRKLEQDVEGFWDFIRAEAGPDDARREWLAAKILGRWPDGTPLVRSPKAPRGQFADDRSRLNDFTYADDPDGFRCPIGAHIRRTNPRDSLGDLRFSKRHRIIRRGMAYAPKRKGDRPGLMFVCFQASIERQFEFVQAQWCGDGNAFGLGSDPDFIVGPARGKMTIQGSPPVFVPMRKFVTTRGGEYFFAPGITALRHIARRRREARGLSTQPRPG